MKSRNLYFESDEKFKEFIEFCNKNMISIIAYWWSNVNGFAIRWDIYDFIHNKSKCDEAREMLKNFTNKKISVNKRIESINITSFEQLKLLEALSQDIENAYYDVIIALSIYRDHKKNI